MSGQRHRSIRAISGRGITVWATVPPEAAAAPRAAAAGHRIRTGRVRRIVGVWGRRRPPPEHEEDDDGDDRDHDEGTDQEDDPIAIGNTVKLCVLNSVIDSVRLHMEGPVSPGA